MGASRGELNDVARALAHGGLVEDEGEGGQRSFRAVDADRDSGRPVSSSRS
jgi:hypothetical protein